MEHIFAEAETPMWLLYNPEGKTIHKSQVKT